MSENYIQLEIKNNLRSYCQRNADEAHKFDRLMLQVAQADDEITSRSNFTGHVTCSGLVLNEDHSKVLLIHHVILDRLLAPGGHIENDYSLSQAAMREVKEETDLGDGFVNLKIESGSPYLIDIDSHVIPENKKKKEGEHYHHDFMFLMTADDSTPISAQLNEVNLVEWMPVSILKEINDERLNRVYSKIEAIRLVNGMSVKNNNHYSM